MYTKIMSLHNSTMKSHGDGAESTVDFTLLTDYDSSSFIDNYTTVSHEYSPKTPIMHIILPDGQHERKFLSLNSIRMTLDVYPIG